MKNSPTTQDILRIVETLATPMAFIERDMFYPNSEKRENNAEHSWSLAFVACALASKIDPSLDIGLISQYSIIHDLPEVYAGDVSPLEGERYTSDEKKKRERLAAERIRNEFEEYPWIHEMIEEYESMQSDEAKFVYSVDKLMPVALDLIDKGYHVRERLKLTLDEYEFFLKAHREKAQSHKKIGKYYDDIREQLRGNPEYFAEPK